MKQKRILLIITVAFLLNACGEGEVSGEMEYQMSEPQEADSSSESEKDIYEKGYNLPVNNQERNKAETDCKSAMSKMKEIYEGADKGKSINTVISNEVAGQMMEALKETGCPVSAGGFHFNMYNYEKMEKFLKDSSNGEEAEIIVYELHSDGGIGRMKFIYDGADMYILYTNAVWKKENTPLITSTSYNRIKEWKYTKKGWFYFEYCVPEPPEVSEIVNGNDMIRIKPLKEEYIQLAMKYMVPIGYQGNNLFCSNWDTEHMEDIDYNGLFQYLYLMKHQQILDSNRYYEGIPKEEFEDMITGYLPISAETLHQYAVFDEESQTYAWTQLGCGNYAPSAFQTSIPEVIKMTKNEDGTVTITVNAVCEMLGSDNVFTHELTVRFLENGGIEYLKNNILRDGLERIPTYQYRFEKKGGKL